MYIVIEIFDKLFPTIITDTEGYPLLFETRYGAKKEAKLCQNGKVVKI